MQMPNSTKKTKNSLTKIIINDIFKGNLKRKEWKYEEV